MTTLSKRPDPRITELLIVDEALRAELIEEKCRAVERMSPSFGALLGRFRTELSELLIRRKMN